MPPNQPFLQVMLRWPHLYVLGAWKSRMSYMPAYFFSKDLKPTNLCSSFLWSPRYDHAWKSPGGLGYLSGSTTSFVMWEAEVPLYAPFFLLKLFAFFPFQNLSPTSPLCSSPAFFSHLSSPSPWWLFDLFPLISLSSYASFSFMSRWLTKLVDTQSYTHARLRSPSCKCRNIHDTAVPDVGFLGCWQRKMWGSWVLTEETFHLTLSRVWSWMNHIIKTLTHRLKLLTEQSVVQDRPQPADPLELTPLLFFFPPHTPDLAMWHFGRKYSKGVPETQDRGSLPG